MKKIALFAALLSLGIAVNAQSLNVQSAMSDLKRGYLNKAKAAIDKACVHDDTKDDAKTWYYAGLIYSQIGNEAGKAKSKYKDLDPEWSNKAYNAALRCKELDKDNDYDLKFIFSMVGQSYYSKSVELFNEGKYKEALEISDQAVKIFNNSADKDLANESLYIAGYCCQRLNDNEGIKKYYGPLIRKNNFKDENFKSRMNHVYTVMYGVYQEAHDTANVIKTAERYAKVIPEDPKANLLLAQAYIWTGNINKGIELADKAATDSKGTDIYLMMLCAAAGIHEQANDFSKAEEMYMEALNLQPNQFEANYGMGGMMTNRASEKNSAINKLIEAGEFSDEATAVMDKLTEERNEFLNKSIPYLKKAIEYIDNLPEEQKIYQRQNLYNCLNALNNCYIVLEMYNESKPIKARLESILNEK